MSVWGKVKNMMFRGEIKRTAGEVSGYGSSMVKSTIKVHDLELKDSGDKQGVGLELVQKAFLSYQMTPVTLTRTEARKLRDLLDQVISS